MKFKIKKAKMLKDFINLFSSISLDLVIHVENDKIVLMAQEVANVCYLGIVLEKNFCEEYSVTEKDVERDLCVDIRNLLKVFKSVKPDESVNMSYTSFVEGDSSTQKLIFQFKQGKLDREFRVPLLDEGDVHPQDKLVMLNKMMGNDLVFKSIVNTDFDSFKVAIESTDISNRKTGDDYSVQLAVKDGFFKINPKEDYSLSAFISFNEKCNCEDSMAGYSFEYLMKFVKVKLSDRIQLKFSENYPLLFTLRDSEQFMLLGMVAPRVERDD